MRTVNDYTPEEDPGPTSAEPDEQTIAELMRLVDEYGDTINTWAMCDEAQKDQLENAVMAERRVIKSALRAALAHPPTGAEPVAPDVEAMALALTGSDPAPIGGGLRVMAAAMLRSLDAERRTLRNVGVTMQEQAESLSKEAERYRTALDRIIGLCGDFDKCACGRPTGIPAIVMCANAALAAKE